MLVVVGVLLAPFLLAFVWSVVVGAVNAGSSLVDFALNLVWVPLRLVCLSVWGFLAPAHMRDDALLVVRDLGESFRVSVAAREEALVALPDAATARRPESDIIEQHRGVVVASIRDLALAVHGSPKRGCTAADVARATGFSVADVRTLAATGGTLRRIPRIREHPAANRERDRVLAWVEQFDYDHSGPAARRALRRHWGL